MSGVGGWLSNPALQGVAALVAVATGVASAVGWLNRRRRPAPAPSAPALHQPRVLRVGLPPTQPSVDIAPLAKDNAQREREASDQPDGSALMESASDSVKFPRNAARIAHLASQGGRVLERLASQGSHTLSGGTFIGREEEVGQFREGLHQAQAGRASVLLSQQRAAFEGVVGEIFSALESRHVEPPDRRLVASVAVICGSSRGGTSLLFRELARSPHLISARGEQVPFEKLYFPGPAQEGSDRLNADSNTFQAMADGLWAALGPDLGSGAPLAQVDDSDLYGLELAARFLLQWPSRVTADGALAAAAATSHTWQRSPRPRPSQGPDSSGEAEAFFGAVRDRLAASNGIDPRYYDGAEDVLGSTAEPPAGPPDPTLLIEEPPFIVPLPRRRLAPSVAMCRTLLLKSSVMAYRLPLLQRLFPQARVHLIHVRRNPAAAINGLIDGWHHWGFFSHNVEDLAGPLQIAGYSDRYPWGDTWWNFDLPPGWQQLVGAPLADVCAFQWASAHHAILEYVEGNPDIRYITVDFEDMVSGPSSRQRLYDRITQFLSIPGISAGPGRMPPRPVMATSPPEPRRWTRNAESILPALSEPFVSEVARRQGYDLGEVDRWL